MRRFLAALAISTTGLMQTAQAEGSLVLVELYTSQGCSSCPEADVILAEIAKRDDVLALGLHVDYWDYLGWQDHLAQPEFTERQAAFNTKMDSKYRLVTPQMIFNGRDYVAGAKRQKILDYVEMLAAEPERAGMVLSRDGAALKIVLTPVEGLSAPADIHLIAFEPSVEVKIEHGENAGRHIDYVNTVTDWSTIGQWNGTAPMSLTHPIETSAHYAVVVQSENLGPVLAARRLD
ncbi:DUF1223 domain-containing protein [Neptunicoccus sediminis]|uniref:DUF1223 domain-containing protein n=1 Tax=Neptunicoccus sediminis TaxID=1892596 RepID=UPI00084625E0|nr:DUF1223 domain-containing protein [Neptunicoccus sediminis]